MKKLSLIALCCSLLSVSAHSATDFDQVEISTNKVADNVYMLQGMGGNIGLLATDDGFVLVDDQFAPLADKIEAAMKDIKDVPIKYVVNTHYHGDHTGANAHFGKSAPIFAHHNVRKRVAANDKQSAADLPVVTYNDGVTIYIGDEQVSLSHLPKGHTDGDSVVYFKQANVLHMGDLFFQGRFPFIDLNGGGSVKGYLANIKSIINTYPDDVVIIPGHGELSNKQGVQQVIEMIEYSIASVDAALKSGKSKDEIIASGLGEKYKAWSWQFIDEERWLNTILAELAP
ncbi:MBL fold metallo-hydrolase [Thalassotalea ponticola]|uniref:MBL fold metallo-hydrolase n=1 Tax=Thalassotalea ponticola TaxID=1523392 RepID=UPI0025B54ACB|nr:MBL fold metallo-hydrolase [Thalassotalea ponticola]MDN3653848.1 MBL fold metallo-hydrolase [Thalassotalea ponticola]